MYGALNLKLIGIVAASVAIFIAGWLGNGWRWEAKHQTLLTAHANERAADALALADAQAAARQREHELQAYADKLRKEMQDEEKRLVARYESVISGLRNRPEARASGVPPAASTGVGSTGAQLARPDSEFLARYARDAARLEAAYLECKAKYEVARKSLVRNKQQ